MRRSRVQVGLRVVVRTLIFVVDEETERRAEGNTVFTAGLDVDGVVFGSLAGEAREETKSRDEQRGEEDIREGRPGGRTVGDEKEDAKVKG